MNAGSRFVVRAALSAAAGEVNEDAHGHQAQALWVLDGATGVATRRCTPGPSDAAWLAQWVDGWLHDTTTRGGAAGRRLDTLAAALRAAFDAVCTVADAADAELPCACLALVEHDAAAGELDIRVIGDVTVLVAPPDGGLQTLRDDAAQPFGERTLAAWRAARAASDDPEHWWAAARATIVGNREHVNRPGGYGVVHPRRDWAGRVQRLRLPAAPGTRVLVASDGLYRLVDLFARCDDGGLLERAFAAGAAPLLAELRALEAADPHGDRHPRVKRSDDATLLAAEIVPGDQR